MHHSVYISKTNMHLCRRNNLRPSTKIVTILSFITFAYGIQMSQFWINWNLLSLANNKKYENLVSLSNSNYSQKQKVAVWGVPTLSYIYLWLLCILCKCLQYLFVKSTRPIFVWWVGHMKLWTLLAVVMAGEDSVGQGNNVRVGSGVCLSHSWIFGHLVTCMCNYLCDCNGYKNLSLLCAFLHWGVDKIRWVHPKVPQIGTMPSYYY